MNSNRRILPGLKENNIGENIFKNIFSEISKYSSRFDPFNSSILNSLDSIFFIFVPFVSSNYF